MKPPKLIYVGPTNVDVKFKKNLSAAAYVGEFDEGNTAILLRKEQSEASLRDSVIHEILHVIIYLAGIRQNLNLPHDEEEKLVVAISPWILALMRDNPTLVEFLMENREREF